MLSKSCNGLTLTVGILLSVSVATAQDAQRVLSAHDTLRLNTVRAPQLAPDNEWVLYTLTARDMDAEDLTASTQLWRIRSDGGDNHQLTRGKSDVRSPAWSPDGRLIAFLAARGDEPEARTQLHFMRADGGEAWSVTEHDESVTVFRFAPDGTKVLFLAQEPESEETRIKRTKKDDAEVVDQTYQMSHLWVHDLSTGESQQLTHGAFTVANPDWSPDSRQVAYEQRPTPAANDRWRSDIWVVSVDGGPARLLHENGGSDTAPRWSPDGQTIAYTSNPISGSNTSHNDLHLISPEGGEPRVLLDDIDLDMSNPIWSPNGQQLYWSIGSGTATKLFVVSVESGAVLSDLAPGGRNVDWQLSADGSRWVWVHTDAEWPGEIYVATQGENAKKLTDANQWLRDEDIALGTVETVRWQNSDAQWIEGVLTKPVGYQAGLQYPFIVNPHGGPTSASLEAFNAANQFFAGQGYMVLQPNFRGSTNYGQAFVNANIDNWGVTDYDDVMTGVDFAISRGWADPDRLICYGWSYGGFLSAWIATQTDRFKAVSPGAALTNLYSMYSTNDLQDYLSSFFDGSPWAEAQNYRQHSPITYASDVRSPVLLMHGASDTRVPQEQSVEFYRALKDLGKDVSFVRFPREGHGLTEPRHLVDRLRRYAEFFGKHVGNPPTSEQ